jgi:superfamily II DNA or RNA helicase
MTLWPYQHNVIADFVRERAGGKQRIIIVAPTGAGKTIIGAAIIKQHVEAFKNVLVLAHRREIIKQTSKKLHAHGIIQAGLDHLRSAYRSPQSKPCMPVPCDLTAWNCRKPICL